MKTKTKTASSKMPRGVAEFLSNEPVRPHFDSVYSHFAEEHYGKYLIVANNKGDKQPHNRFYLCHESMIELMGTYTSKKVSKLQLGTAKHHTFTRFSDKKELTWNILSVVTDSSMSRQTAKIIISSLSLLYEIFCHENIEFNDMNELSGSYIDEIVKHVQGKGTYLKSNLQYLAQLLRLIEANIKETFTVPDLRQYGISGSRGVGTIPTLAIQWQLDIYAEQAIETHIKRVKQYQQWMKELDEIGELFSLKNLAYTFFNNLDIMKSGAGAANIKIRKLAFNLHGIELRCWKSHCHMNKYEREREAELRNIGEGGINIAINDERMFAMWHKVILPNYPYENEILSQYACISENLEFWRANMSTKVGTSRTAFDAMIYPSYDEIYPLYLMVLCRTGINQGVVQDWRILKNENEKYCMGIDSGMGRLVDGDKGRGNTEQTAALDRQLRRYVDFFTKWMTPLFDHSQDDHFFQNINIGYRHKNAFYSIIDSYILSSKKNRKQDTFYHTFPIMDEVILPDGKRLEKRVTWIHHDKIRKIKNLSEYLEGKDQYIRKMERGHKNLETEYIYQQSVDFDEVKGHQIAMAQYKAVDVFMGKVDVEANPKLKIFTTPMSNCKNSKNPTYIGVKELHNNDVCTNWSKCLTSCDQSEVIAKTHGPVIVAWRNCMDDMHGLYPTDELWERVFYYDYQAAISTLESFSPDIVKVCEEKASKYADFVRRHVLNSRHSRKLTQKELEDA